MVPCCAVVAHLASLHLYAVHFYIVMELCKTSLQKIAESKRKKDIVITEEEVKRIMRDVTLGLKGLHDRFIVHLDIKPGRWCMRGRERVGVVLWQV